MRALFTTALLTTTLLIALIANAQSQRWQVFRDTQSSTDTAQICLVNHAGAWVEADPSNPANCQEMLVAGLDSYFIWPDNHFYARMQWRSTLFRRNPYANYGLDFDQDLVLRVLNQAGTLQRLDQQVAKNVQRCTDEYNTTSTISAVDQLHKQCGAYAGAAYHQAYNRALNSQQAAESALQQQQAAPTQPHCSIVRFTGIAVGGDGNSFEQVRTSPNPEDIVARYPLRCGPSGITQTYTCQGAAHLRSQTAYIISWSKTGYQVATPIDLQLGRKDALVFIKRTDAICLNSTSPSLDFLANLHNFLKNHSRYR